VSDVSTSERKGLEEFLLLPPPIQEAWSQLGTQGPALVIIDSWDALVEQYLGGRGVVGANGVDRAEIERVLLRRMGRTPAHLVLVRERRDESQLDYLVNGVVVTDRERVDDRLERWLTIPKLRGLRVANPSYPYTVESARFQCIEPVRAYGEIRPGRFDPEPDRMPNYLWPGSRSLAEAFGRFPIGKTTLLETDGDVPDYLLQLILGPAIGFAMSRRGHVVLIPSAALSAEEIWATLSASVPRREVADSLRVLDVTGQLERNAKQSRSELSPAILSTKTLAPSNPPLDPEENELSRFLRGAGGDTFPSLAVLYLNGLQALIASLKVPVSPELMEAFPATIQGALGSSPRHFVAVGRADTPFFEPFRSIAAVHIHVRIRQGRAFLYGSKPWTPGFVLTEGSDGGPFELLRIV
jgi:hypothetical protein